MVYNEAEMMKDFLNANKIGYGYSTLIKKIITKEPNWVHDFPCISVYRSSASEELVLGDSFDADGRGKFEPCTLMLSIYTQSNIARFDDSLKSDTDNDLDQALNLSDLTFALTGVSGILVNTIIQIDDEKMKIKSIVDNNVTVFSRGFLGTIPATHLIGVDVFFVTFLKDEDLVRTIREKLIKLFFDKRDYENISQPKLKFNMMLVSSDVEGMGITSRSGTYMITLSVDITASIRS